MSKWTKATKYIRDFNGCVQTRKIGDFEFGIFKERYGAERWNYRKRPIDESGEATDSWGFPLTMAPTKREVLTHFERMIDTAHKVN